jgi:hypothetical protein
MAVRVLWNVCLVVLTRCTSFPFLNGSRWVGVGPQHQHTPTHIRPWCAKSIVPLFESVLSPWKTARKIMKNLENDQNSTRISKNKSVLWCLVVEISGFFHFGTGNPKRVFLFYF